MIINLQLTEWAIECGCHFVDLGGNQLYCGRTVLSGWRAKNAGVGIIPDCGLAPGMASIIAAHAIANLIKWIL